ncbi:class IV adenylate cyclase [Amycolatopsis samaneae]|uniref:Class IV adenylate cyclase n=1 Tax=Amycolatopsis samaneae TaxID=664691 RepID=A0ABW5GI94_9PSEU
MSLQPEYEARFTHVDVAGLTAKLAARGAVRAFERTLMKRVIFQNDEIEGKRGWLRLRQEAEVIMLTYKQATGASSTVDSVLEVQTAVGDFEATQQLLEAVGLQPVRYQENYREEWRLHEITFDFDTWPGLPTFLEVEGPDEDAVRRVAAELGLDFAQATFGAVDELYQQELGRNILEEAHLTF